MSAITASPWHLVALSAAAGYCIVGLQIKSGWFDLMDELGAAHPTQLPGTGLDGSLPTSYTGIKALDPHIAGILRAFYAMSSGEYQPVSLFSFWFAGQLLAVHTLQILESLRVGNRGKLISHSWLWGIWYQLNTIGITTPIWVAVWLWTSPIANMSAATSRPALAAALTIDDADLSVLPHSLIWGHILPTVLACLPSPTLVSYDQKVKFLALWQFFPILTSVAHFFLSTVARRLRPRGEAPPPAEDKDGASTAPAQGKAALAHCLRHVYVFVLIITATVHALTILYALFPSLRPLSLAPADPASVNLPSVFTPALTPLTKVFVPVQSIAEGVLNLLQYDVYAGAAAMHYWALQLYWAATDAPSLVGLLTMLAGPAGAALVLVWRRDEHVLLADAPKAKAN